MSIYIAKKIGREQDLGQGTRYSRAMRRVFIALCLLLLLLLAAPASAQLEWASPLQGTWLGWLDVPGARLRLVLRVLSGAGGRLLGALDSPDQGATGIPADEVKLRRSVFRVSLKAVGATFEGRLRGGVLDGRWTQSGRTFPLQMRRIAPEAISTVRPQDPVPPFPYAVRAVTFLNARDGVRLAATMTVPPGPGPFPAVILLPGAGPMDRDERIYGHRPLRVLADFLARQGYVVLRADKRGVGGSSGDWRHANLRGLAADGAAAVDYLKRWPMVDAQRLGLFGHGEGGEVAALVAGSLRRNDIAFVVLMGAPAMRGDRLIQLSSARIAAAEGAPRAVIARQQALQERILPIAAQPGQAARVREMLEAYAAGAGPEERARLGDLDDWVERQIQNLTSPWMRFYLRYDPVPALRRVRCPLLALYGARDLQVPADGNAARLRANMAGNADATVEILPDLNHLFQTAPLGIPTEYLQIDETIAPAALGRIADWLRERLGGAP